MPGSFDFLSTFTSDNVLAQTAMSQGTGSGIDTPNRFSALGGAFTFNNNEANIVPVAVFAGQTLRLDVDFGSSNNIDPINTELWLVDAFGNVLATNDNASADLGSTGVQDPRLSYTAAATGLVYVVVVQRDNNYLDGEFRFDGNGSDTGVFQLNISLAGLDPLLSGTSGDDSITLLAGQTRYRGLAGNDSISSALENNSIAGGSGNDSVYGNELSDLLYGGVGQDYLNGNGGADVLVGGEDYDSLYGGAGRDQLFGSSGDDSLNGGEGNDLLRAEIGNDNLDGGEGNDRVYAGAGQDYLYANLGNDLMDGADGSDTYYAYSGAAALTLDLRVIVAQDTGAYGIDRVLDIENVTGTNGFGDEIVGNDESNSLSGYGGDDLLIGLGGTDYMDGGEGSDELRGGSEYDSLYGGNGDDIVYGGAGNDYLRGGAGRDHLWGQGGTDVFYFYYEEDSPAAAPDIIEDFESSQSDKIGLSNLPDTLIFRGNGPFQNTGGEVRTVDFGAFQRVYVNLDTDSAAEMIIRVNTPTPLLSTDFYL